MPLLTCFRNSTVFVDYYLSKSLFSIREPCGSSDKTPFLTASPKIRMLKYLSYQNPGRSHKNHELLTYLKEQDCRTILGNQKLYILKIILFITSLLHVLNMN